jgi:hypothetical protein
MAVNPAAAAVIKFVNNAIQQAVPATSITDIINKQHNKPIINIVKNILSTGKYGWNDNEIHKIEEHATVVGRIIEHPDFFITEIMYHPVIGDFLLREYRSYDDVINQNYDNIYQLLQFRFDFQPNIFVDPNKLIVDKNILSVTYIDSIIHTFGDKNDDKNYGKNQFIRKICGNISKSFIDFSESIFNEENLNGLFTEVWTYEQRRVVDGVRGQLTDLDGIPYFLIGKHSKGQVEFYNNIDTRWFFMTRAERDEELNRYLRNATLAAIMAAALPKEVDARNNDPEILAAIMAAALPKEVDARNNNPEILAAIIAAALPKEVDARNNDPEILAAIMAAALPKEVDARNNNPEILAAIMAAALPKQVDARNNNPEILAAIMAAALPKQVDARNNDPEILAAILASITGNTNEKEEEDAIRLFIESGILYKTPDYNTLYNESMTENKKQLDLNLVLQDIDGKIIQKKTEITINKSEINKLEQIRNNPEAERKRIHGLIAIEEQKNETETDNYNNELAAEQTRIAGVIIKRIGHFITAEKYPARPAQADSIQTYVDFLNNEKAKIQTVINNHGNIDHNTKGWEKTYKQYNQRLSEINRHLGQLSQNAVIPEERINIKPLDQRLKQFTDKIEKYNSELGGIEEIAVKIRELSVKTAQLDAELRVLETDKTTSEAEQKEALQKYGELTTESKLKIESDKETQEQIKTEIVRKTKEMRDQGLLKWFDKKNNNIVTDDVYFVGTENKLIPFFTVFELTAGNNDYKKMAQFLYNIYKSDESIEVMKEKVQQDKVAQNYQQAQEAQAQAAQAQEAQAQEAQAQAAQVPKPNVKQGVKTKTKPRGTGRT